MHGSDFDLIAIHETWLKSYILNAEILPHGYEVLSKDRETRAGGGVLLAEKKRLTIKNILQLPGKSIAVELNFKANKLALVLLCHWAPDNQELLKDFHIILERLCKNLPGTNNRWLQLS